MNDNIESMGEKLKKIRLEKGLSLEEVYKKTKIHPKTLEDLEQDNTLGMNPVYLRGFIKIYCQFLGVAPQDYIKDFKKTTEYPLKPKEKVPSKPALKLSISKPHPKLIKTIVIAAISIAVLFALFKMGQSLKSHIKSKVTKDKKSIQRVINKTQEKPEVKPLPPSSDIRLGIHAREDCWLKIKVDGKTVFERTLKKGQSETWQAKEKIELQIGNAAGIDLDVNGKILSPLGKKGHSVKRAVITKEGFEALR